MPRAIPCFTGRVGEEPLCCTKPSPSTLAILTIHSSLRFKVGTRVPDSSATHPGHPLHSPTETSNRTRPFLGQHLPGRTKKVKVNAHAMLHTHYWQESSLLINFLTHFLLNCSPGTPANACKDRHILGDVVLQPASPQAGF